MGETLKKEGVGLSVQLTSKSKAQTLIDKICEHINAVRFSHPATGKLTFRLIRDDYKIENCLRLNPSNCSKADISRLDWSETISEVSVSFIDRANQYEMGTIPARDPANIEIHHGVQTVKTYDYNFFTTPGNAKWAAERELHAQGYPLATVSIEGNRELSGVRIGDVVVLDWAPYGIGHMLLRVTSVDLGDFLEGRVQLETIEDVFGLSKTDFSFSGSTQWKPEDKYPTGVQIMKYLEMPYEIICDRDTYVAAFAARPDKNTDIWTIWRHEQGKPFISTSISFAERNNRQSFGAVSQDDVLEYWTKQPFKAAEGTDYIARLTVGENVKEYAFSHSPITLGWERHCLDFQNLADVVRLELYARREGLFSYQAHERTFHRTIPTLVDIVTSEDEARKQLKAWGIVDRIIIPKGKLATSKQVIYKDLPFFALGKEVQSAENGAIFGHDGKRYLLMGEIFCVSGREKISLYTMKKGYAFNSYYVPSGAGGEVQSYAWDGETIKERRAIP